MQKRAGCNRAGRRSAFTLLEVLVALALVSVITLSLYSSLRIGFNAQESAIAAVAPVRAATAGIALLRRDIESALPPTGLLAGEFVGEDGIGETGQDSDTLRFYTCSGVSDVVYPEDGQERGNFLSFSEEGEQQEHSGGDMQEIVFALLRDDETSDFNLVRSVTKNLLATTTPEPIEQVICRNVLSFNVRYLEGSEWIDSWDSTQQDNALPMAMEVSLEVGGVEPGEATSNQYLRESSTYDGSRTQRLVVVLMLPCISPSTDEGNRFIR